MDNPWWASVLEWGPESPFARAFDIDWARHPGGKLVLPVLPTPLDEAIRAEEIALGFDPTRGSFYLGADVRLPVSPVEYGAIVRRFAVSCSGPAESALNLLAIQWEEMLQADRREWPTIAYRLKRDLASRCADDRTFGDLLQHAAQQLTRDHRFVAGLAAQQKWRATYWRTGRVEIPYRRFFEIDALAGVRVDDPVVFEWTHALIFNLIERRLIHGLRIDHIDGLADPHVYLERLQQRIGPGFFIVVEKILARGEVLRPDWPVAGATGYEVLAAIDALFVDPGASGDFDAVYRDMTGFVEEPETLLLDAKAEAAERGFVPELQKLVDLAFEAAADDLARSDITPNALHTTIRDFAARLPVYRTYLDCDVPSEIDRALVLSTLGACRKAGTSDPFSVAALERLLLAERASFERPEPAVEFRTRLQQLTGPVMAKGQEDTFFYRYLRHMALNEVGGDPARFGIGAEDFHRANAERCATHPATLIATTTHDTKRGEDVRGRLLTLDADDFGKAMTSWIATAKSAGFTRIHPADHYLIMQNALGAWPTALDVSSTADDFGAFAKRVCDFAVKALREAKLRSNWIAPHARYEDMICASIRSTLTADSAFTRDTATLRARMFVRGGWASAARTVLKCTLPGVPDFYQGSHDLDLSLVDPDNRRRVDFDLSLSDSLDPLESSHPSFKRHLIHRLLTLRADKADLFASGAYEPISLGENSGWIAF